MAVDQPRRDRGAAGIDDLIEGPAIGEFAGPADGGDPPAVQQQRIGRQDRVCQIAGQQQADAPHQHPPRRRSRRLWLRHAARLPAGKSLTVLPAPA